MFPLTSIFPPTTTHSTLFCVRAEQWREWRKSSQYGHQRWAPAHLQRAPALSLLEPIKGHLLPPISPHKHSRKPRKFQFSVSREGALVVK